MPKKKIISKDLESVLEVLRTMCRLELTIKNLYNTCAGIWQEDAKFWKILANEENEHARNIGKMISILKKKTELFQFNRPLNISAVKATISYVKFYIQKLKSFQKFILLDEVLIFALDLESSLLEHKYTEIVKTDDIEYNTLSAKCFLQSEEHRKRLIKKMAEFKKKSDIKGSKAKI